MLRLVTTFAVVGAALPAVLAVAVAPDSPCSTNCGNVLDSTSFSDLACSQGGYEGGSGEVFQGCVQCEMTSGFSKNNHSDAQWSLYNLRYALSNCLFGYPDNKDAIDTPCVTSKACGPFRDAVVYGNLSTSVGGYDYCDRWDVGDKVDLKGCTDCLQAGDNYYLANFVTYLQAGCEQRPIPGVTVAIEGDIFSSDNVNVTAPTPSAKVNPEWFDQGPLGLGAKVGIAVGGFVLLLIALGFLIVWNGKRRRRAYLRTLETKYTNKGWPSSQGPVDTTDTTDTPLSQRPLRGWDDSPMSENTEKNFPRYFSPYSSQYTSPVSATDATNMQWPEAALPRAHDIGMALGPGGVEDDNNGHWNFSPDAGGSAGGAKGKDRQESYEMHEVESSESGSSRHNGRMARADPPVLNHPGYGRNSSSPPRHHSLTAADARSGNAF